MLKPEILSPAGSAQSAVAAVNNGCDAIYMGGGEFNARRYADSPDDAAIEEIIRQCHLRGVKVHITLNILYKDSELKDVLAFAAKMYSYGADAFIIQDLGFFSLAKKYFPDIALHASTQMTAHSRVQAETLKELGFDRVVLSRELSLEEIKETANNSPVETEVFVHGALCVSYSGRCLMSSMLGGRSGNRGSCAQTCRMEYRLLSGGKQYAFGYLLSPKDTCALTFIPELTYSGVTSWKIEGRMKSPEYVALVTSMYRKYADSLKKPTSEDMKKLTQIFNRGGELGSGYYFKHSGKDMLSASPKSTGVYVGSVVSARGRSCTVRLCEDLNCGDGVEVWTKGEHTGTNISKAAKSGETITLNLGTPASKGDKVFKSYDKGLIDSLKNTYSDYTRRRNVKAELKAEIGKPLHLKLTADDVSIECLGAVPEKPLKNSMTFDDLTTHLSKTGNTPFILNFEKGECGELYVPLSSLKELKRNACAMLEKALDKHYRRDLPQTKYIPFKNYNAEGTRLCVQVYGKDLLETAVNVKDIDIYCEMTHYAMENAERLINRAHSSGSRLYYALPVIERNDLNEIVKKRIKLLENTGLDGYLARNIERIDTAKPVISDYTINVFNSASRELMGKKCERVTLSPELNIKELRPLCGKDAEIVVYGRLPLMTTQQCPVGVHMADKGNKKYCSLREKHPSCVLKDRKGAEFPVFTMCESCAALILNSAPIYVGDRWKDIPASEYARLIFTTEDRDEMLEIIEMYKDLIAGGDEKLKRKNTTAGHFYRGVV